MGIDLEKEIRSGPRSSDSSSQPQPENNTAEPQDGSTDAQETKGHATNNDSPMASFQGIREVLSRTRSRTSCVDPGPPPDGGLQAWTQVIMGHLTVFNTWGYINSFGVFQTYYVTMLKEPPSAISWVGSVQSFLLFFVGTFSGRATDYGLFRITFIVGSIFQLLGVFMTSLSTKYWHLFLAQGILTGLGNGLVFCPTISIVSTYFSKKKSLALGLVASGSATGGLVFPIIVQQLLPKIGFPWTVRILGFVMLAIMCVTLTLTKPRLPPRKSGPLVEWAAFKELPYALFSIGMFLIFLGLYFAFYYIGSFGRNILGNSEQESINNLLILNGVGLVGRLVPAHLADRYFGPFNLLVPFALVSGILLYSWSGVSSSGGLVGFAVIYGLFSAGIQSLFPATLIGLRYSLEQSRWVRVGYDRSFQTRAAAVEKKGPAFGSLENQVAWADKRRNVIKTRLEDNKDIYIDDLSATLEAHRESNRALTIRRVETVFDERSLSFLRPLSLAFRKESPAEELESTNVLGGSGSLDGCQQEGSQQIVASETDRNERAGAGTADNLHASSGPLKAWQHWPADSIQYKDILGIKPSDKVTEPSVLEYVSLSPRPCKSWLLKGKVLPDDLQWPWLAYVEGYEGDGPERLQKEIKAFETYTRLTPSEKSASEAVITDVEAMVEQAFPSSTLSVVGSHRTGLATPTSDIDFSLSPPSQEEGSHKSRTKIREVSQKILRGLQRHLHKSMSFREAELVFGSIPIIRATHYRTGLKVQISTQSPDRYDRDFTAAYLAEFPTLRPIFIVLRYALEMRGLNTPFEGGLGSYSIFMMIVAALKQASGQHARDDHANHLLHVLHFYSSADLYDVGFCVDPPRTFTKAGNNLFPLNHRKPYLLCLQDPADAANDLGRKAYAIKHVQRVFERARVDIMEDMLAWERKTVEDRKSIEGGLLNRLLRANYETLEFGRRRMHNSVTAMVDMNFKLPMELKAPDFSRLLSLKGLRKKGWADEVNAERKRRGRQKREETAKRRALLVEKRNDEAKILGAEE